MGAKLHSTTTELREALVLLLEQNDTDDAIIIAAQGIALFLAVTKRQSLYLIERGALPTWRKGRRIFASKSLIRAWIKARENAAQRDAA